MEMLIYRIIGVIFLSVLIFSKPITSIISKAWHKEKLKQIDIKLKGEIDE